MSNIIYIYHIPGKKIGVTKNLFKRVTKQQGYKPGEYEILGSSDDIEWISKTEKALQIKHGYKKDFNSYKSLVKQRKGMEINVTEQTTTFPAAKGDALMAYLKDNKDFKFMVDDVEVRIDDKVTRWILANSRVSHFRKTRAYVYNQSLKSFIGELVSEHNFKKPQAPSGPQNLPDTIFDKIRSWADTRGIYTTGDPKTQLVKLVEEQGEVARAILKKDLPEIKDGIGDMVVVLTNLAHLSGFTIEECIQAAYTEIKDRKGKMDNGTFKKETL